MKWLNMNNVTYYKIRMQILLKLQNTLPFNFILSDSG